MKSFLFAFIHYIKVKIKMVMDRLNNIMNNYDIYFKLMERNLNNYNENHINYNILQNINYIYKNVDFKSHLINDISKDGYNLIMDINFKDFIPKVLNIYNEMNKNEINLVYNIPNNENKVKIFNSFFVNQNKDLCKIIYENKEYDLTEYFYCENIKNNLLKFTLKGINNVSSLDNMFEDCSELSEQSDFSNWDTTFVTSMERLFHCCEFEKLPDISNWNTSSVLLLDFLFSGCSSLKYLPDISNWNTSNAICMEYMFSGCTSLKSLPDISKWDITNAKEHNGIKLMFAGCSDLLIIPDKFQNTSEQSDD